MRGQPQLQSALNPYNTKPLPPVRGGRLGGGWLACPRQTSATTLAFLPYRQGMADVFGVAEVAERVCTKPSEISNPAGRCGGYQLRPIPDGREWKACL